MDCVQEGKRGGGGRRGKESGLIEKRERGVGFGIGRIAWRRGGSVVEGGGERERSGVGTVWIEWRRGGGGPL